MTDTDADLAERIESWLSVQLPRIQSHGGTSAVREVDTETGRVVVELGGACAGCGISQTTEKLLEEELPEQFGAVDAVSVKYQGDEGWAVDQPESFMGIDRNQGGRGGEGESRPATDFF
ncbi:MAG: NifU family protein [Halodesulfurarchaeum sp.]